MSLYMNKYDSVTNDIFCFRSGRYKGLVRSDTAEVEKYTQCKLSVNAGKRINAMYPACSTQRTLLAFILIAVSTSPTATQNTIISGKYIYFIIVYIKPLEISKNLIRNSHLYQVVQKNAKAK